MCSLMLYGCTKKEDILIEGYRPVYGSYSEREIINSTSPQAIKKPGKIYYKDGYLFINEINQGVHVFDNKNPASPVNIGFISIPGNIDIAIKGSTLYADNYRDLVAINISDPANVKVVKRITGVFPDNTVNYPEFALEDKIYFDCVDASKGYVKYWEKATLKNPKCYR